MVAYKLLLLENSKIYHVFHISLLKKQVSETAFNSTELPPLEDDGFIMMEPESILNTRWVKHGSKFFEKKLTKWRHLPAENTMWEKAVVIHDQFLNLEDKVLAPEEGNDEV